MRKRKSRYARGRVVLTDLQEMDLLIGSGLGAFKTERARREAWMDHRDEMLSQDVEYPYSRDNTMPPDAMITFELGGYRPGERMLQAGNRLRKEGKLPLTERIIFRGEPK